MIIKEVKDRQLKKRMEFQAIGPSLGRRMPCVVP